MNEQNGTLYVVATPIGNLGDISARAIDVLKNVQLIAAEDTRHTRKLLNHFGIQTPTLSLHDYNENTRISELLRYLEEGQSVAVVSDAGTPLISDPGFKLVSVAREAGFAISPIPGCCALIAALSAAGIPSDRFCFEGFLPAKTSARVSSLQDLKAETRTMIFYESKHRIVESLKDFAQVFGEQRQFVLVKELTKAHENFVSGAAPAIIEWLIEDEAHQKGEFVIIAQGLELEEQEKDEELEHTLSILMAELPLKQAAHLTAKLLGLKKNRVYKLALERQDQ